MTEALPPLPAPGLTYLTQVRCDVGELLTLGPAPAGERRVVPLLGGEVSGPALVGRIVPGGADWQWNRSDGALEIAAHYVIETAEGARIEVQSNGLRHGPAAVLARLARGEAVAPHEYFFRTLMRFATGHAAYEHLNRVMAVASGRREARRVVLDVWQLG
ncbi:MAG: DUF3237 domain-containing protein [Rubrivivax sp.]|nr:DUF3237 domain-containing protein [Rubrivivax sp.]